MNINTNRIVSIIAHDLKDPLSSMSGITDILINNWDDFGNAEKLDILNEVRDTSDATLKLLTDLLDWSKKINAISGPEQEIFDAGREISSALEVISKKTLRKKITIDDQVTQEVRLQGDVNMFAAIFRNLVANAVKSCREGGEIVISVADEGAFARFCITDDGIGMTSQQIDILFSHGNTSPRKSLPSAYGNGFGLILCKDFVDMQGGKLWAESQEGKGTHVYFTFPAAPDIPK